VITDLPGPSKSATGDGFGEFSKVRLRVIQACCIYVAVAATLPQYVVIGVGPITLGLIIAGALALLGWSRLPGGRDMNRYMLFASLLAAWVTMSAIGAWLTVSMYEAVIYAGWLVFLLPGLASLMRREAFRHAFIAGWVGGASYYALTAFVRFASGRSVFDGDGTHLLGEIRGGVNAVVLVILPYLLIGDGGRVLRIVRWPLSGAITFWVVQSGGRSGFLGLAVALLVVALARPGVSRQAKALLVTALMAFVALSLIQSSGGQATESTSRLTALLRGERNDSDDARELLLRKAWYLALDRPAFGVGFGRFEETEHSVVNEAQSTRSYEIASTYAEHNTFAGVMAEAGFPAFFLFIGLCLSVLVSGVRHVRDRGSRAAVASLAALYFTALFHTESGPRLFLPIALALASTLVSHHRPEREPSAAVVSGSRNLA
jgi:O-antigen ligase